MGSLDYIRNNTSWLDATNTGICVYVLFTTTNNADIGGTLTCVALVETSDVKVKENIKEVSTKDCHKVVQYVKPKKFNFMKDESK